MLRSGLIDNKMLKQEKPDHNKFEVIMTTSVRMQPRNCGNDSKNIVFLWETQMTARKGTGHHSNKIPQPLAQFPDVSQFSN